MKRKNRADSIKPADTLANLRNFRGKLKRYQDLCGELVGSHDGYSQPSEEQSGAEERLRQELTEEWGRLEPLFRKLGLPLFSVRPSIGIRSPIFDDALEEDFESPEKFSGLRMAVQIATKAIGAYKGLSREDATRLFRRQPLVFISYSFDDRHRPLTDAIRSFVSTFSVAVVTGEVPGTESISEKVKRRIADADLVIVILTPDAQGEDKKWRPSKWVNDEVAFAAGQGKRIARILEDSVHYEPGISGDAEYIKCNRDDLGPAFTKLSQLLHSLVNGG